MAKIRGDVKCKQLPSFVWFRDHASDNGGWALGVFDHPSHKTPRSQNRVLGGNSSVARDC